MDRRLLTMCFLVGLCSLDLCAQTASQPLDVCDLIDHAMEYNGKTVYAGGLWKATPHGTLFIGSSCTETPVSLRQAAGYKANRLALRAFRKLTKKDHSAVVAAVFRGSFRVARQGECFGEFCSRYEMEIVELASVQEPAY